MFCDSHWNLYNLPDLGESQKSKVHDSIASSKPSSKQVQKNEKSTNIETQIEGEVNIEKQEIEIVKFAIPDLKDSKSHVEVDFSTPYNSPEQEKKWRSWGKDIDWN